MTDTTEGQSARWDGDDVPTQTLPSQALPAAAPLTVPELTGVGAGIVGAALTALGVWGLHVLTRADGVTGAVGWVILLCLAFSALGKGITLLRRALAPLSAVWSASISGIPPLLRALVGIVVGAAGIWWVMRGHATFWWTQLTGSDSGGGPVWSLPAQLMLVAIIAAAGALVFGGTKTLGKLLFANSGTRALTRDSKGKWALWWASHPGLGLSLLAGGATLVFLSGYVVPRVSGWLSGDDPMAALAAITAVLALALLANTWWWRALSGWWTWAHTPNHPGGPTPIGQIYASAGVLALIAFSATAFGLASFSTYLPQNAAVASADPCGPDGCGGGGNGQGSYGPDTGNFQPPQMPAQQPDYQGGINQPPLDQNSGISIYNETPGQGGQQPPQQNMGPQMPGQRAAHGEPLPNYGPWQPDAQSPVQQAPVQQAPQAPQQPAQAPQPIQQQAPAPEQMPAEQPVQQAPPQQPVQQGQPGQTQPQKPPEQAPPEQPDAPKKSVIDPTDLAVAATRRGSQQAGQQAVQQGTAQAVSKSSQITTQMSGTATNMSGPAPMEPTPSPNPGPLWQPTTPDGPAPQTGTWVDPNTGQLIHQPPSFQPSTGNAPQTSPPTNTNPAPTSTPKPSPTQSPNLGPEIRDTLPDPKDPTEVLHQWADLAGKIDAHNAKIVNPSDPLQVSEYEREFFELNSKLLELSAEMVSLGIPHEILPAPNSITIGGN